MRICIDPGHSGPEEPGACAGGATEAAVTLQAGLLLADMLAQAGHKVKMTRQDDIEDDGLLWRAELSDRFRADIFISLHCNASTDPGAHGVEVWHYPGSVAGERLARSIQGALAENTQLADRGIKSNDVWTVLSATSCPAVLVEMAFLTNEEERGLLTDKLTRRLFAAGIAKGVEAYAA